MRAFFKTLPLLFFNRATYANLVRNGKGFGLAHIFLLAFLSLASLSGPVWFSWHALRPQLMALFDSLPTVSIAHGTLALEPDTPRFETVFAPGTDQEGRIVIDPTVTDNDQALADRMRQENIFILAARDRILILSSHAPPRVHLLDKVFQRTLTPDHWHRFGAVLTSLVFPIFVFCGFVYSFLASLLSVLAAGFVLFLGGKLLETPLSGAGALRLAAASRVPSLIVTLIAGLPSIPSLIAWALWALFGFGALRQAQAAAPTSAPEPPPT